MPGRSFFGVRPAGPDASVAVVSAFPLPESPVTRWFRAALGEPTRAQALAWPAIAEGRHVLVISPTGTGKTLAAFLAILHDLALQHAAGGLGDSIQAVYVSPLRALGYDLAKNLRAPLEGAYGGEPPIRVALRTGDTDAGERRRQALKPPHVLLTTPESLLILLSQERWKPALSTVRWVVVDEVHALAENKRGAHLSLSLERLDAWVREGGGGTGFSGSGFRPRWRPPGRWPRSWWGLGASAG